jgi:hypothetical protein
MTASSSAFEPDDPYALTVEEARAGLELLAFRSLDTFKPMLEGQPGDWTVEQLAIRVLAIELFSTSVKAFALEERLRIVEAALGVGRN